MRSSVVTRGSTLALVLGLVLGLGTARAGDRDFVVPARGDKCPVCGMFVSRHPDWVAGVRFADGSYALFDGAKDLFRFLNDVGKYAPSRRRADVRAIFVTDYYAVRQVDARTAWFVVGGDVLGPMGRELVPFATEAEARGFLSDHGGQRVLRFADVTPLVLRELE